MKPEYPNVACGSHPGRLSPGYAVCDHVGRRLRQIASSDSLGVLICDTCDEDFDTADLHVACAHCVSDEVEPKGQA